MNFKIVRTFFIFKLYRHPQKAAKIVFLFSDRLAIYSVTHHKRQVWSSF